MKNLNKVRDMTKAKRYVVIHGDYVKLKRIQLLYEEYDSCTSYSNPERNNVLVLRMTVKERDFMVKSLNLKLKEGTKNKKDWVINE